MPESDLVWMSLLYLRPSACALALLLFPPKWTEAMAGSRRSARPSTVSLIVVVGYELLDRYPDANGFPRYGLKSRLDARADQAASDAARPIPGRCCPTTGRAPAVDRPLRHPVRTRRGWHQFVAGCSHCAGHVPGGGRKLEDRAVRSAPI